MIRLDDLQYKGLFLYQDSELACFSEDALLLSHFLTLRPADRAVDLGAGNGVIGILGAARTGASFTCVEQQEVLCALARRSAAYNGLDMPVYCMDVAEAPLALGHGAFTAATMNPPYFTGGDASSNPSRAAARHDTAHVLDAFLSSAFLLLKNGGRLFCCYPAAMLVDLFASLRAHRLEPKRISLAAFTAQGKPARVLVEAKKDGHPGLIWD